MKRKRSKQLAGLCLLLSAALSLCSCGRSASESGKENDALAKEYVYRFQEIAMPDLGGDEYEVCASGYRDGEIFLLMKVTDWEHYNDNVVRILSVDDDGRHGKPDSDGRTCMANISGCTGKSFRLQTTVRRNPSNIQHHRA